MPNPWWVILGEDRAKHNRSRNRKADPSMPDLGGGRQRRGMFSEHRGFLAPDIADETHFAAADGKTLPIWIGLSSRFCVGRRRTRSD